MNEAIDPIQCWCKTLNIGEDRSEEHQLNTEYLNNNLCTTSNNPLEYFKNDFGLNKSKNSYQKSIDSLLVYNYSIQLDSCEFNNLYIYIMR